MTTDYVKRHGLKPAMRAFSVNDTMINGAPEHGHILAIHLPKLRTLVNPQVKFIEKIHQHEHSQKGTTEMTKQPHCCITSSSLLSVSDHCKISLTSVP